MNIYTPYVYLIGWSALDRYYIGSRYAKDVAHPSDLWTTYFTSSTAIARYREEYGEPDIIMIRNTFTEGKAAHDYETKLLRRLDARRHPKLINSHNNDACGFMAGEVLSNIVKERWEDPEYRERVRQSHVDRWAANPELKQRQSDRLTGKKRPDHADKMRGRKLTENQYQAFCCGPKSPEHIAAISAALKGIPKSEDHKQKLRKPKPKVVCRISDRKLMGIANFINWQKRLLASSE